MPSVSLNVKHQLSTVIKRFKFEELEDAVTSVFPEISWREVKSKLIKNHESFTTLHALKFIEEKITEAHLDKNDLEDRLATLEVIDVSRHYRRKVWYCYEIKGRNSENNLPLDELLVQIKDSFHVHRMQVDVRSVEHNNIIFVSVKDRPKKKPMKTILPTFFSLIRNENFFFTSKKIVLKTALIAITNGMGYQNCKKIKLMGKDIPSLVRMLIAKKIAAQEGKIVQIPMRFKQTPPRPTSLGLDFTQHKHREKYAEKYFGKDPPIFEFLRVKSSDQSWKSKVGVQLPEDTIPLGVEFRSTNISNFLKNLVGQQVLKTPLPCYAANILTIGRNDLTLKEN